MATEQSAPQPTQDTPKPRVPVEERVERFFTFWGNALVDAFRLVFSPKEGNQ